MKMKKEEMNEDFGILPDFFKNLVINNSLI